MKAIPLDSAFPDRRSGATNPTGKLRIIVPLSVALIAGTGGTIAARNISYGSTIFTNPMIELRGNVTRRECVMSIADQVNVIRNALGLRMSEVAQILGVTRPTAYAWLNGSEPKQEIKSRISRLRRIVEELHDGGVTRIDLYARSPLVSGRSLIDSMKMGTDVTEAVSAIKRTALQIDEAFPAEMNLGPTHRKRVVDVDEISVAIIG